MTPLQDAAAKLIAARKTILLESKPVLDMLKDKGAPLDERWKVYTDLVENEVLIDNESFGNGFLDELGGQLTMYDSFYTDRHTTVQFTDMYDQMVEDADDERFSSVTPELLAAWQETVLVSGNASFTYDW